MDPGFVIFWSSPADIDHIMGLANSPLPHGNKMLDRC